MDSWQDIETAPKDGTSIILHDEDGWVGEALYDEDRRDGWYAAVYGTTLIWDGKIDNPIHWMPLPAPPEGE